MNKKIVSVGIINMFLLTGLTAVSAIEIATTISDNTIYVDDDAPPEWYDATHVRTINEGIKKANIGDTVFVYNGNYNEQIIISKNLIKLIGEDKGSTIIDSQNFEWGTIEIAADGVKISDFTIKSGWWIDYDYQGNPRYHYYYGVESWKKSNLKILNNEFINSSGVYIDGGLTFASVNNIISGNIFHFGYTYPSSNEGVLFRAVRHSTISDNELISKQQSEIDLWFSNHIDVYDNTLSNKNQIDLYVSNYNKIYGNTIDGKKSGDNEAVVIWSSVHNDVNDNTIVNHSVGIELDDTSHNSIYENAIENNDKGIYFLSSLGPVNSNIFNKNNFSENDYGIYIQTKITKNTFSRNEIRNNKEYGIYFKSVYHPEMEENSFYLNNFINNGEGNKDRNAYIKGSNTWHIKLPLAAGSLGNYWDDWKDNPGYQYGEYWVPGGDNIDKYPLEEPFTSRVKSKSSTKIKYSLLQKQLYYHKWLEKLLNFKFNNIFFL